MSSAGPGTKSPRFRLPSNQQATAHLGTPSAPATLANLTTPAKADVELRTALPDLERVLALDVGPVRLGQDGELIIHPLSAEDIPAEAEVLKAELTERLPFAPIEPSNVADSS